jgi:hypothetical protein
MQHDKIRPYLLEKLAMSVANGTGTWSDERDDILGPAIYAYRDPSVELVLFEAGMRIRQGGTIDLAYSEITELVPMLLRDLMAAIYKHQDRPVELRLRTGDLTRVWQVPLKLYTTLHSQLPRVLRSP